MQEQNRTEGSGTLLQGLAMTPRGGTRPTILGQAVRLHAAEHSDNQALADTGELFTGGHVEDALGADGAFQQHFGGALVGYLANRAGAGTGLVGAQDFQGAVGVALGQKGGESAFAGDL